jgi:ribonuclease-3
LLKAVKHRTLAQWLDAELLSSPLFAEAVTHRSASGCNNERLEYLGDAVLGLIIAEHLFRTHVDAREGDLSRLRAHLVRKQTLARIARELHLSETIVLGPGELKSGGDRRDTILADTLEAIVGAVYLTKGMEYTKGFVLNLFQTRTAALPPSHELRDPKTRLQEYLQSRNLPLPAYGLRAASGEPHAQRFTIYCRIESAGLETLGDGSSKREAEQTAAAKALAMLLDEHASG